jgi:hypothetical protein
VPPNWFCRRATCVQYRIVRFASWHCTCRQSGESSLRTGRHSRGAFGGEVVRRLHRQPCTSRADAGLFEPYGQVRAHPGVAVKHPAQRHPRDAQPRGGLTDAQPEVGQDVLAQDLAGVRRSLSSPCPAPPPVVVLVVDELDVAIHESERDPPVLVHPDRPVAGEVAAQMQPKCGSSPNPSIASPTLLRELPDNLGIRGHGSSVAPPQGRPLDQSDSPRTEPQRPPVGRTQ